MGRSLWFPFFAIYGVLVLAGAYHALSTGGNRNNDGNADASAGELLDQFLQNDNTDVSPSELIKKIREALHPSASPETNENAAKPSNSHDDRGSAGKSWKPWKPNRFRQFRSKNCPIDDPLILTPLIQGGNIAEAQEKAQVSFQIQN